MSLLGKFLLVAVSGSEREELPLDGTGFSWEDGGRRSGYVFKCFDPEGRFEIEFSFAISGHTVYQWDIRPRWLQEGRVTFEWDDSQLVIPDRFRDYDPDYRGEDD